ncbi:type II toxin-antitoxin system HigB family toxin [Enterobacter hormaechei]|uniref:type II toxin-antitoxin system HigB family toxin n=1 Tax=Enterobacter hormaechei TaxID=158836 RepID=UPI000BB7A25B|nr:type II toxin-antitoxin system HigB family toxin [Enterobacter hormaechei]
MKIIAIKTLRDFWTANPDAEQPLKAWVDEASKAEWKTPAEIKEQYKEYDKIDAETVSLE